MRVLNVISGAIALFTVSFAADAAVTLTIENDKLVGATNVNIGGDLFDVSFVDGTCADVFGTCGDGQDFDIFGEPAAKTAMRAIRDQVFLNDGFDFYESCTGMICAFLLPYDVAGLDRVETFRINLIGDEEKDYFDNRSFVQSFDTSKVVKMGDTFADFTYIRISEPSPVISSSVTNIETFPAPNPEPATWLMLLAGFAVCGFALKRRALLPTY